MATRYWPTDDWLETGERVHNVSEGPRVLSNHPFQHIARAVARLRRLQFEGLENIPTEGPALIAATHSSPLDLFYYLSMMQRVGRHDHRFVLAAELVNVEAFRAYAGASLRAAIPGLGNHLGFAVTMLSHSVPPLLQRMQPIPVYRQGDDSESRRQCVQSLVRGELLTIAPGWGNDEHRGSDGMRPLTHGVASITRQYFEAMQEALPVIPLILGRGNRRLLAPVLIRIGSAFPGISAQDYPALYAEPGAPSAAAKHIAYQRFTQELASRLSALL